MTPPELKLGRTVRCWNGRVEYDDVVDLSTDIKARLDKLERQDWHCLTNPIGAGIAFENHGIDGHPLVRTMMRLQAMADQLELIEADVAEFTGGNPHQRWTKACQWDNCKSTAFVCFSSDNPYAGSLTAVDEVATIPPKERPPMRAEGLVAMHPDAKHVIGEPSEEGQPCA